MTRESYVTSFAGLFTRRESDTGTPVVDRIEIPLIQRDYAQGRQGAAVEEIRTSFLDVLHSALAGEQAAPIGLDFVYGEVKDGTLRPLDGQQRLTTLFLLHWYLAWRAGRLDDDWGWKRFSYATRPSARLFCERLVTATPAGADTPSEWLRDQSWYLYLWRYDPTIQSMLVMIDAIHERFADVDAEIAWQRLVDPKEPAISFHLLPIDEMGSGEDLYIKMNSRGKPLTEFENFKVHIEETIEWSDLASDFSHKVDGAWSDVLWEYRGADNIVDDEFMRYIEFIIEICEWREERFEAGRLWRRAEQMFGADNPRVGEHLDFLFSALDTWIDADIRASFEVIFATPAQAKDSGSTEKVVLFGPDAGANLFEACCRTFGDTRGNTRVFSLSESLLLYAVVRHRIGGTGDFPRRLRVLRNLIEASNNEMRQPNMPKLLKDVDLIVVDGTLDGVVTFNQNQVEDERLKATFLGDHPELTFVVHRLEDHPILRGSLSAFQLDPAVFESRAEAFDGLFSEPACWPALTGALLACGEYQRSRGLSMRSFLFGTGSKGNENTWRELLAGASRDRLRPTREALARLLDEVTNSKPQVGECLDDLRAQWLVAREAALLFDWRYYFVRYDSMREGKSGIYFGTDGRLGYAVCMLDRTQLNSVYRDPYLLALWRESGAGDRAKDPWFTGYETTPRWLRLTQSDVGIRSVDRGWALQSPASDDLVQLTAFEAVVARHHLAKEDDEWLLVVSQELSAGQAVDTVDRIQVGADLLKDLVEAGL